MPNLDDIKLTNEQVKELVDENVFKNAHAAFNNLIVKKVDAGIKNSMFGGFVNRNDEIAENQTKAGTLLNKVEDNFMSSIPEGITVGELNKKISNLKNNVLARNSYALGLNQEQSDAFHDKEKTTDADLIKVTGVIANVDELSLKAAGVKIPVDAPVVATATVVAHPAKKKTATAIPVKNNADPKPDIQQNADDCKDEPVISQEAEQLEKDKAKKELEERNKQALASSGFTNSEAVATDDHAKSGFNFKKLFESFGKAFKWLIEAISGTLGQHHNQNALPQQPVQPAPAEMIVPGNEPRKDVNEPKKDGPVTSISKEDAISAAGGLCISGSTNTDISTPKNVASYNTQPSTQQNVGVALV